MASEKTCFKCRAVKPLGDFYRHPQMADGHLGKCKECTRNDVRRRYSLVIEDRHAYDKARSSLPEYKDAMAANSRRRRALNPEKAKARDAVNNAIRDGRLRKEPCFHCGSKTKIEAHHRDYLKPLDVQWVCFKCHREREHGQTVTFGGRVSNPQRRLPF